MFFRIEKFAACLIKENQRSYGKKIEKKVYYIIVRPEKNPLSLLRI